MSPMQVQANEILARLPADQRDIVERVGTARELVPGKALHAFGQPTTSYFFPTSGVVSLTVSLKGDQNIEVGLVGREGIVGVGALLGANGHDLDAMAQVRGEGIEVPVSAVSGELERSLRTLAARYTAALIVEIAQTAACNRLHSVEQRTARWLLQASDHARTNDLQLTHEFLAMMLAVRRASVTVVVGVFNRAGVIVSKRGTISLADRDGLGQMACECYEVIRAIGPTYN